MNRRSWLYPLLAWAALAAPTALAHKAGVFSATLGPDGCNQCHSGGSAPTVTLSGPTTATAGVPVTYQVQVSDANGGGAGFTLGSSQRGVFSTTDSAAGAKVKVLASGGGGQMNATHNARKEDAEDGASDSVVTFEVEWTPPALNGTAVLTAWGNAVDGSNSSSGDRSASQTLTVTLSCTPTPQATACAGKNCGGVSDGCGGTYNCGSCTAPQSCGGGGTPNVCGCTPATCAALGKNCGTASDGCGGSLECGTCAAPETCGGGGIANVCSCPAETIKPEACNGADDDCNGFVDDGTNLCSGGQVCQAATCVQPDGGSSDGGSGTPPGTTGCSCNGAGPLAPAGLLLALLATTRRGRRS